MWSPRANSSARAVEPAWLREYSFPEARGGRSAVCLLGCGWVVDEYPQSLHITPSYLSNILYDSNNDVRGER